MKKLLLALAVLGTVSFAATSCNKNDDEKDDEASIVGTWEESEAHVTVKTSAGVETSLEAFFKTLGIPTEDMEEGMEEGIPGRIELTSDGKLIAYEKDEKGKWVNVGAGTYTLKGDQLTLSVKIEDEDGVQEEKVTATVKSVTAKKAEIRLDMTEMVQMMFAALTAEDPESAEMILALFKGCSFYADVTLKRV